MPSSEFAARWRYCVVSTRWHRIGASLRSHTRVRAEEAPTLEEAPKTRILEVAHEALFRNWRRLALTSSRVTPLITCPLSDPGGVLPTCPGVPRTAAFRRMQIVGFPLAAGYPYGPRLYQFRDSITRPVTSLPFAPRLHRWLSMEGSLLTSWLGVHQVGLECKTLTHRVTSASFIGLLLFATLRACLGTSMPRLASEVEWSSLSLICPRVTRATSSRPRGLPAEGRMSGGLGLITLTRLHACQQIRLTLTRLHPYQQSRLQIFVDYAIASHKEVVQP
jgi:hypothetical protein